MKTRKQKWLKNKIQQVKEDVKEVGNDKNDHSRMDIEWNEDSIMEQ